GRRVLDVGCGAAQTTRWLAAAGADVVAFDLSRAQLAHAGTGLRLVQADAERLPFADAAFDLACSAYGALPFVADSATVMRDAALPSPPAGAPYGRPPASAFSSSFASRAYDSPASAAVSLPCCSRTLVPSLDSRPAPS